ncbi:manganese ABC transporter ATP-binding protein [Alkalihalophilus pseudofirmus]|uniref:metal ABC transporter ATP-binding protein n=1 Tax=Alkalihalophilus TaxID=2893060 RepID=UPI000950CC50|nr:MULTISPECIES: metal ABC transporter ATP-binding protein [Alkalihalophilus]MED1602444.1 metal ABC transporter ATP-binding protein [Alkalihalophilus marmarensis]OLS35771.1 manganese ABC transporter ATP-binding protein [Alkalihalophilus pseudofirmus]WEG18032.1 metal ABC transporter ATP-binding protein [Alkalihalophilus pseudofirmus]
MKEVIEVSNLSVYYENNEAIKNISFKAGQGQLIGIVGPNGAGKSTLMKAVLGLEKYRGNVSILGKRVQEVRKQISYVPQRNQIDWDFPVLVEDVVMMGRAAHIAWYKRPGKRDKEIVQECLDKVGMTKFSKRQIGELSGGQQQRVFIARSLAQQADIFFLDEPFVGIDVTSEEIIIDLLRELKRQQKTVFVVHHDLSKVQDYFDQLLLINKELIQFGAVEKVYTPEILQQTYKGSLALFGTDDHKMVVTPQ